MSGAILEFTELQSADLEGANLQNTNLNHADLKGASLKNAVLTGAKSWTEEQLAAAASLEGATMPNGQKYEDWLKDREKRQQDE
jgi:uncharacterized protein YjbI with pentapeptide repeats